MKKAYLIIGSNNFWYSTETSRKAAFKEAKRIAKELHTTPLGENTGYPDYYAETPDKLLVFEAIEIGRQKVEPPQN